MTETERQALGRLAQEQRRVRFDGIKKDVYWAAGVNPATLDRIEEGLSVKDRSLVAVVRTLWPSTDGDWRLVLAGAGAGVQPAAAGMGSLTDAELMGELARRLATRRETTEHGSAPAAHDVENDPHAPAPLRGVRARVGRPRTPGKDSPTAGKRSVKDGGSDG